MENSNGEICLRIITEYSTLEGKVVLAKNAVEKNSS